MAVVTVIVKIPFVARGFAGAVPLIEQPRYLVITAMDPATIQGVTRRLKARGLITGRADPRDGRRILLRLSAKGARLAESIILEGFGVSEGVLEPLSGKERKQFLRLLKQLT